MNTVGWLGLRFSPFYSVLVRLAADQGHPLIS